MFCSKIQILKTHARGVINESETAQDVDNARSVLETGTKQNKTNKEIKEKKTMMTMMTVGHI